MDMFPNGEQCCSTVHISYQGINIDAIFNDLFEAGNGSYNISLSRDSFSQLAPLEVEEIYPVVWNL
ncbi:hypothetical protein CPB84DRAFT_1785018 [Gymnopilus junonius]|uniref:Uncharacterized protein n=1 Tax=Gymnopilus junonius TaxID=109634 RepID=A0A9P5NK78_GYMJU|nr:hypothetical protein CPB84DRAFT_1785018 [Gymnopilus junonius]